MHRNIEDHNQKNNVDIHDSSGHVGVNARSERLREIMKEFGGNNLLAKKSGIPIGNLNRYIAGQEMKVSSLVALAEACGVSVEWLATGKGRKNPSANDVSDKIESKKIVSLPYYDKEITSKYRYKNDNEVISPKIYLFEKEFVDNFFKKSDGVVIFTILSDNMFPTIYKEDNLVIDTDDSVVYDGLYAVVINGQINIKRIKSRQNNKFILSNDNSLYSSTDMEIDEIGYAYNDGCFIFGRIISIIRQC